MLRRIRGMVDRIAKKRTLDDLVRRGLTLGPNVTFGGECMIDAYCWLISIGNHVAVGSRVQIITHDASTKLFLGFNKIGKVVIGDDVFIGQGSIILPNVTIGNRVLVGAGSVVAKDIPSNSVAFGNPARVRCTLDEYLERNRILMKQRPIYDKSWHIEITKDMKNKMVKDLEDGIGFFE